MGTSPQPLKYGRFWGLFSRSLLDIALTQAKQDFKDPIGIGLFFGLGMTKGYWLDWI